jgi:hypothetical protein
MFVDDACCKSKIISEISFQASQEMQVPPYMQKQNCTAPLKECFVNKKYYRISSGVNSY